MALAVACGTLIVLAPIKCVLAQAAPAKPAVDLRALDKTRKAILLGRQPLAGSEADLQKWYYQKLVTMATAQEGMGRIRREIVDDLRVARSNQARQFVRDYLLQILPRLVQSPKVRDAAKVNGLLILGQLNDAEAQLQGGPTPQVPSAPARKLLLNVVDANPSFALKIAALVGLRRHVTLEMLNGGQRLRDDAVAMVAMLTRLLDAKPPVESQRDGYCWSQRLAAEILGTLGTAGPNGQVVIALDKVVRDEQRPEWLRCAALDALGRITIPAQVAVKPDETLAAAGKLAIDSCNTVAARLQEWEAIQEELIKSGRVVREEPRRASPPPPPETRRTGPRAKRSGGRRGSRRNRNEPDPYEQDRLRGQFDQPAETPGEDEMLAARRRLKQRLGCVRRGLSQDPAKGVRALASKSVSPKLVDQLDKQMAALLAAIDQRDIQPAQLRQTIESSARSMTGLLAGGPGAAKPPAPATPAAAPTSSENPF